MRPPAHVVVLSVVAGVVLGVAKDGLDLPVGPPRAAPQPGQNYAAPPVPDARVPKLIPPPVFYGVELDGRAGSLVYVLDASCSMVYTGDGQYRPGQNRWDLAVAEFERSLSSLPHWFDFGVVVFECAGIPWRDELVMATPTNKAEAVEWIRSLRPSGGTGTGPAMVTALGYGSESVVLLTDGDPNCGFAVPFHRAVIRDNNTQGARIDVFGLGARGAFREFCQDVAADSGGAYYDVGD